MPSLSNDLKSPAQRPRFFISYRNVEHDAKWAYWVAWQLEEKYGDKSCIIQDWDFSPHSNFVKEMQKGATCAFTIAIISPHYFSSDFTADEWTAAFKDRKLILLEVVPCEAPGLLSPLLRLSLHGMDEATARERLLAHLERVCMFAAKGRAKPIVAPSFPATGEAGGVGGVRIPCNIPYPPTRYFVRPGLEWEELLRLRALAPTSTSVRCVCVLCGLHGSGKTQAATMFAWTCAADYSALLWVRGDSNEVLRDSLAGLCGVEALDLPEQDEPNIEVRMTAVRRWLKEHPGWLLVADNIDGDEARVALLEAVPASFGGTILVTSCLTDWAPICNQIELNPWPFSLCAEFLISRLRLPRERWPVVAFIGDILGGLPLALEQAAAFLEQTQTPVELYLSKLLEDTQRELNRGTRGSTNYPSSLSVVLQQALERVSSEARFLLELASFLSSTGQLLRIYETIAAHSTQDHAKKHGIDCHLATPEQDVLELNRWSLVRCRGDEFDVHPLVQGVVRNTMQSQQRAARINVLTRLFFMPFAHVATPNSSRSWNVWRAMFPHIDAFILHLRQQGNLRALGYFLNQMALFLGSQGLNQEALALLHEAVQLAEAGVGQDNADTAAALSNLGELLATIGSPAEAKPFLLRAIAIVQKSRLLVPHGESSCWNNLGLCHLALGEKDAAEAAFRKATELDAARGGQDDDFSLIHQINLANLWRDEQRYEDAESIYRNAISRMTDGVRLACALTNLGILLYRTKRAAEAVSTLEQAVQILSDFFAPGNPEMRKTIDHLAVARKIIATGTPIGEN